MENLKGVTKKQKEVFLKNHEVYKVEKAEGEGELIFAGGSIHRN